ncbi:MAG: UbiA family prenyltransferase [Oscillospiraceae bacterium]|nr:UbiA family prenyltransferase [Oscillospiraceae bacterium]
MKNIKTEIQNFFSFVEITTKIASLIPFWVGLTYAFYLTGGVNIIGTLVFFAAGFLFDMSTTAINMYIDHKEAGIPGHYSKIVSLAIIFSFILTAGALGLLLTYWHGLQILLAGGACFAAGIFYTYGPAPISKSPYGEAVSGIIQGFVLTFIVVAINAPPMVSFDFNGIGSCTVWIDIAGLAKLFLVSFPMVGGIANIMLANNISDLELDRNTRYTLPRHIGVKNALRLFAAVYYSSYLSIAAACFLRVIPWTCLLVLPTLFIVQHNIKLFFAKQSKSETFPFAIINFVLINAPLAVCIMIGGLFKFI